MRSGSRSCPARRSVPSTATACASRSPRGAKTSPRPRGAFYAFANVAEAKGGRDIWALVEEWLALGVAVLPGTAFGPEYGDWVRMSLATRREDIGEAARRLKEHYAGASSVPPRSR